MNLYPTADGEPGPARNSKDRNARVKAEFLAAYHSLNCCYGDLLEIRRKQINDPARDERAALRKIETALRLRDQLEDRYAPYGVIAEPIMEHGFAVDVKFSFGSVRSMAQRNAQVFSSSAYISIPQPASVRPGDLSFPGKEELMRRLKSRLGKKQPKP